MDESILFPSSAGIMCVSPHPCAGFTCKRHSWVCNIGYVDVSVKILSNASCMGRCCGGMALLVQGLRSSDPNAYAFIQGCGTIMQRELQAGEVIVADSDAVLAFSDTVGVDVKTAGNCFTMCCGGEGMFNTVLTGPGTVYLQSMPIEKLRRLFPQKKKKDTSTTISQQAGHRQPNAATSFLSPV